MYNKNYFSNFNFYNYKISYVSILTRIVSLETTRHAEQKLKRTVHLTSAIFEISNYEVKVTRLLLDIYICCHRIYGLQM